LANVTIDIATFLGARRITLMRVLTGHYCLTGCLAVVPLAIFNPSQIYADGVTAIEEDWQLDIDTPNSLRSSPQIKCLTSTGADVRSQYAVVLVNQPGSVGVNLQLQLWEGSRLLTSTDVPKTSANHNTIGERINWTTRLSINNGVLTAEVFNFSSTTWGNSSGKTTIASISAPTSLNDLSNYDPNVTCVHTGVEFGSMRVQKLMLRKARVFTGKQKSVDTSLERVVFQNN
jgi:hypothetical protein